jgi:hypothetical protein
MDKVQEQFHTMAWRYAPQDPQGCEALNLRIAETGRRRSLITYSDLVRGIAFHWPGLQHPDHQIDVNEWQDLDRAIIGDFLGYLSMMSYDRAGFFCSALVVSKDDGTPGEGFYTLLKDLGLIRSSKTDKAMYIWADHVAKAHSWYTS